MRTTTIIAAGLLALAACEAPQADSPAVDPCGAASLQHLVGAPLPDDFAPPDPARVFDRGDPVTMDFRPERLNVELDPESRRVDRVFCG